MLRIVARNGRSLSKIRIMPSAIVSNRMVYTGIMPLRHSRIIAAAASDRRLADACDGFLFHVLVVFMSV